MTPRVLHLLQQQARWALDAERRGLRACLEAEQRAADDGRRARALWRGAAREPAHDAGEAARRSSQRTAAAAAIVLADRAREMAARETLAALERTKSAHTRVRVLDRLAAHARERALESLLRRECEELEVCAANRASQLPR